MLSAIAVENLINKLVRIERDEDPSLELLLSACPGLRDSDEINRFTSVKWFELTRLYSTSQLEWLIKAIVVAERDLQWTGGSVAAAIWLFAIYKRRADGDWPLLAEWILRNKENPYLPFGSITLARSLQEWHMEQEKRRIAHEAHLQRQHREQAARAQYKGIAQDLHLTRRAQSQDRKALLIIILDRLREIPVEDRLAFIANEDTLPLEAIPIDLIQPCVSREHHLEPKVRARLLKRMDRRNTRVWKALRMTLK